MSKKTKSNIFLLITSIIWGSAFVAQKTGAALEPFTYNGIRTLLGALSLLPVIAIMSKLKKPNADGALSGTSLSPAEDKRTLLKGGFCCGLALFVASSLQQFGMYFDSDAGKAGFITALYIVIVPILGIFIKKKIRPLIWFCVILGAVGFYLLTMAGKGTGFELQKGDFFVLLCAFAFSVHILVIDHFSPKCDGVKLSCIQFFVAGMLGIICMFIFETPNIKEILSMWFPIFYAGVFSSGIGYTLQVVGQKDADPAAASLILSLESVFAVLTGVVILSESLTLPEVLGCIIIFIAVIVAQLPSKNEG